MKKQDYDFEGVKYNPKLSNKAVGCIRFQYIDSCYKVYYFVIL